MSTELHNHFFVIEEKIDILFVDDDPILREFAQVHLSTEMASVETAEDGLAAVEKVKSRHPDLILLDLEMPNMDGFQFLRHLSDAGVLALAPVIVATGREDVQAIDRAYQAGATSFVVKPLNWRQLSYQIRYVHRTFLNERNLRDERDRAQDEARRLQRQLVDYGRRSLDFVSAALQRHPDLRPRAAAYIDDLTECVADPATPSQPRIVA